MANYKQSIDPHRLSQYGLLHLIGGFQGPFVFQILIQCAISQEQHIDWDMIDSKESNSSDQILPMPPIASPQIRLVLTDAICSSLQFQLYPFSIVLVTGHCIDKWHPMIRNINSIELLEVEYRSLGVNAVSIGEWENRLRELGGGQGEKIYQSSDDYETYKDYSDNPQTHRQSQNTFNTRICQQKHYQLLYKDSVNQKNNDQQQLGNNSQLLLNQFQQLQNQSQSISKPQVESTPSFSSKNLTQYNSALDNYFFHPFGKSINDSNQITTLQSFTKNHFGRLKIQNDELNECQLQLIYQQMYEHNYIVQSQHISTDLLIEGPKETVSESIHNRGMKIKSAKGGQGNAKRQICKSFTQEINKNMGNSTIKDSSLKDTQNDLQYSQTDNSNNYAKKKQSVTKLSHTNIDTLINQQYYQSNQTNSVNNSHKSYINQLKPIELTNNPIYGKVVWLNLMRRTDGTYAVIFIIADKRRNYLRCVYFNRNRDRAKKALKNQQCYLYYGGRVQRSNDRTYKVVFDYRSKFIYQPQEQFPINEAKLTAMEMLPLLNRKSVSLLGIVCSIINSNSVSQRRNHNRRFNQRIRIVATLCDPFSGHEIEFEYYQTEYGGSIQVGDTISLYNYTIVKHQHAIRLSATFDSFHVKVTSHTQLNGMASKLKQIKAKSQIKIATYLSKEHFTFRNFHELKTILKSISKPKANSQIDCYIFQANIKHYQEICGKCKKSLPKCSLNRCPGGSLFLACTMSLQLIDMTNSIVVDVNDIYVQAIMQMSVYDLHLLPQADQEEELRALKFKNVLIKMKSVQMPNGQLRHSVEGVTHVSDGAHCIKAIKELISYSKYDTFI